jgi:Predicted transcriptional regulator
MVISYDKLWKLLIDKKMNKTELKDSAGITYNILARLGKCEPVNLESLYKICKCLNCNIEDIMEFKIE